ncbi:MAG: DUF4440 domain-containing protein [Bacteroidia bacterium]
MKTFVVSLFLTAFAFSAFSQTYTGDEQDIESILDNITSFSKSVMAGDEAAIAAAYTEDAKIFPNNRDIIAGQKKIQAYWKPQEGYSVTHHKITPSEIKILGDEAYDYGYYEGTSQGPDGKSANWKGKYVIVWKKIDGEWKIYLDIWNNIQK